MNMAQKIRFEILRMRINAYKLTTDAKGPWEERKHPRGKGGKFARVKGGYYKTKVFVDNVRKATYNQKLKGTPTSDGRIVKTVSGHAVGRAIERGVPVRAIRECLFFAKPKPDPKYPGRLRYEKNGYRVSFDPKTKTIVTVIDRDRRRHDEWKKKWKKISKIMSKRHSDLRKKLYGK